MQAPADDAAITAINVTPLVDILLVVLIIFMATAPMISRRALKVDVPKAAHNENTATEALQVVLDAKRRLFLGGKPTTNTELSAALARNVSAHSDLHVTFSADKTLPYGEIVGVLDLIRGAGVKKLGLEVKSK